MILGLRTAIYPAPDLARAKAWYSEILGVQPYFDQPFYVGFSVAGSNSASCLTGSPELMAYRHLGRGERARDVRSPAEARGHSIEPVHDVGDGIVVGAVEDPFGNRFGIIENPHFKTGDVASATVSAVELERGDITRLEVDAIVNAANEQMLGVARRRRDPPRGRSAASASLPPAMPRCDPACAARPARRESPRASACLRASSFTRLGPIWRGGGASEAELLAACYRNSLTLANANGVRTIAFPAISCGVYGFPVASAARIAVREILEADARGHAFERVVLVAFGADVHRPSRPRCKRSVSER